MKNRDKSNLWSAARSGDLEELNRILVTGGVSIDEKDDRGYTALLLAVYAGQIEAAKFLLDRGADPNATDAMGNSILMGAAFKGNLELTQLLLSRGADWRVQNFDGLDALAFARTFGQSAVADLLAKISGSPRASRFSRISSLFKILFSQIFRHLYIWVLIFIVAGVAIGHLAPDTGESLKPLADGFVGLIKMMIAPIIFCTVVSGIASTGDMKKVGRIGTKAILYFEVVSTAALAIGLVVGNFLRPGLGFNADVRAVDPSSIEGYQKAASSLSMVDFLTHIVPKTFVDAFTGSGDLLQVLLLSVLFGWAMGRVGEKSEPVLRLIHSISAILFSMMNAVMKLAPIGAGAAMAFTVGKFGLKALAPLASLMFSFYLTCALFMILILAPIAKWVGFNFFKFVRYIRQELVLVLGTSSSESALVPLMEKLERLGCQRTVVGLVVPSGYSFNLDGTNIYLTLAALFIAQAYNIDLSLGQQLSLLGVATVTSKGASGVTGAGFITLAATLAVVPEVPVAGLALILGVDRFMSEARAITNIVGNGVAALVVSKWENALDHEKMNLELNLRADLGFGNPDLS